MNKVRDYRALEREYITSQMSLRELCRRHGISAHCLVVVQAQKGRRAGSARPTAPASPTPSSSTLADRMAAREAEVRVHAIDAIDEAINKFRADMRATKTVRQPDGTIAEEPADVRSRPRTSPCSSTSSRSSSTVPQSSARDAASPSPRRRCRVEALQEFIEATRGLAANQSRRSHRCRERRAAWTTERRHLRKAASSLLVSAASGEARVTAQAWQERIGADDRRVVGDGIRRGGTADRDVAGAARTGSALTTSGSWRRGGGPPGLVTS